LSLLLERALRTGWVAAHGVIFPSNGWQIRLLVTATLRTKVIAGIRGTDFSIMSNGYSSDLSRKTPSSESSNSYPSVSGLSTLLPEYPHFNETLIS
jgi:hypothetical protein